jgi:hypothetical protein
MITDNANKGTYSKQHTDYRFLSYLKKQAITLSPGFAQGITKSDLTESINVTIGVFLLSACNCQVPTPPSHNLANRTANLDF